LAHKSMRWRDAAKFIGLTLCNVRRRKVWIEVWIKKKKKKKKKKCATSLCSHSLVKTKSISE